MLLFTVLGRTEIPFFFFFLLFSLPVQPFSELFLDLQSALMERQDALPPWKGAQRVQSAAGWQMQRRTRERARGRCGSFLPLPQSQTLLQLNALSASGQ